MDTTVSQRRPIAVPWTAIAIVLLVGLAAAAALVLADRPADVTAGDQPGVLSAPGAGVTLPRLETHAEILALTGRAPRVRARVAAPPARHNVPLGTSLDPVRTSSPGSSRP